MNTIAETSPVVVSVIMISYNTRDLTVRSLETFFSNIESIPHEIWLIDNASTDDTVAAVRQRFPHVHILCNKTNVGFGAANNQGVARARGEFVLMLNTDAFVHRGAIRTLLDCLQNQPDVAVVGPRLLNADGSLQRSCFRYPSPTRAWSENLWLSSLFSKYHSLGDYRHWAHDKAQDVDWITGACMLARRSIFELAGGFDERFFMYAEETDWQRRIRDKKCRIFFEPTAQVTHLGGSSGALEAVRVNRDFFDSLDLYELKHHGVSGLVSLRMAMAVGCFMRLLLWCGAWITKSGLRQRASAKVRLHIWLIRRQLTHWPRNLFESVA